MKPMPRAQGRCQWCGTRIKSNMKACEDCRKHEERLKKHQDGK